MNLIVLPFMLQLGVNFKNKTIVYPKVYFSPGIIFFILLIFCLFASYDGDYWSYYSNYKQLKINYEIQVGMEEVFAYIIGYRLVDSYLYFRFVVWGGGLLLYWLSFKRLGINSSLIWLIFTATTLLSIAYIRAFLGMGFALYGYTYLIKPSRYKILSYIFGLSIVGASFFFHKSMFVIILCLLLSLLFSRKWALIASAVCFPVACKVAMLLVIATLTSDTDVDGMNYLEADSVNRGLGIRLSDFMRFLFVTICLGSLIIKAFKNKLTDQIKKCTFCAYYIFYMYCVFYAAFELNGMGGAYLCDRIFVMLFTIFPILFYNFFKGSKRPLLVVLCLWLATLAFNYRLIYSYYLQSLNMGMNVN